MTSLRDKVETRLAAELTDWQAPHPRLMAEELTTAVFEAMADQRPCVTCGKGLGPAKVAKGYIQCYDCVRRARPLSADHQHDAACLPGCMLDRVPVMRSAPEKR